MLRWILAKSGLEVILTDRVFVPASGQMLDEIGVRLDLVVEPEVGYYRGTSDHMLDNAVVVIKEKSAQE